MIKRLLVAACVLFTTSTACAQWGSTPTRVFALGGGFSVPTGDLGQFTDTGLLISGYAAGALKGSIGWRVDGSWSRFAQPEVAAVSLPKTKAYHVGGGVQLGGFRSQGSSPYLFGTVGMHNLSIGSDASETSVGIGFGTGFNWAVNEEWGIGLQFTQNAFWPDGGNTQWYSATSFLVGYRF